MNKRYVKECINDWIQYCSTYGVDAQAKELGERVLKEYRRGSISAIEAVKVITGTYYWELEDGSYKSTFLNW